ncbi:MAG: hypothetical protein FWE29_05610 [Defluviitaleaceae bacterium]|nr:hypothetical protein [Defluviitaleaceae bacterium]
MYYNENPFAKLRQGIAVGEHLFRSCGNYPTAEQKEELIKNLNNICEIEKALRTAQTQWTNELADRCSSLQSRIRRLL